MNDESNESKAETAAVEARLLLRAASAATGAEGGPGDARDNLAILLRIVGGPARDCGHLVRGDVVHLHSATGVHLCAACTSSASNLEAISSWQPPICDSCGDPAPVYTVGEFAVDNIIVTAAFCDDCRDGKPAVLPEWVRHFPK